MPCEQLKALPGPKQPLVNNREAVEKPLETPAHPPITDSRAELREAMTRTES